MVVAPRQYHVKILKRWSVCGYPSLTKHAPYAAHIATVEAFFALGLAAHLIDTQRASNRADVAYLHYLPFCHVFVSSDRLHRQCAAAFLRAGQRFVLGWDLKKSPQEINAHFAPLPEEVRNRGVLSFVGRPPLTTGALVAEIWDQYCPGWRKGPEIREPYSDTDLRDKALLEEVRSFEEATPLGPEEAHPSIDEIVSMTVKHTIRRKKGSWYQANAAGEGEQTTVQTTQGRANIGRPSGEPTDSRHTTPPELLPPD